LDRRLTYLIYLLTQLYDRTNGKLPAPEIHMNDCAKCIWWRNGYHLMLNSYVCYSDLIFTNNSSNDPLVNYWALRGESRSFDWDDFNYNILELFYGD
jgi:hypothetical protein